MQEFDHISEVAESQGGVRDRNIEFDGQSNDPSPQMEAECPASVLLWKARLERVIARQVLPRLLQSHAPPRPPVIRRSPAREDEVNGNVEEFVQLLLKADGDGALRYVTALKTDGVADHRMVLDLLAPAARSLGALWDDDRCDFMEVTIGLQRLQQILRALSPGKAAQVGVGPHHSRVLLLPAPGETHVFGVAIVEKFFHDAGWDVSRSGEHEFLEDLEGSWFDVVGFSLSDDRNIDGLASAIAKARGTSLNRALRVLVGGPAFLGRPELVGRVGADAMAADAPSAVLEAANLLMEQVLV